MARSSYGKKSYRQLTGAIIIVLLAGAFLGWRYYVNQTNAEPEITLPELIVDPEVTGPVEVEVVVEPEAVEPVAVSEPVVEPEPVSAGNALLREGESALSNGDYIGARDKLSGAVKAGLDKSEMKRARALINSAADEWLFSKKIFEKDTLCSRYKVKSGDLLVKIGKSHKVPYQLLMKINGIDNPSLLGAGQTIKVVNGPFHLVVDRSDFTMYVYLNDVLVRTYPVGLGKSGRQTPSGLWVSTPGKKQVNPGWPDVETGKYYMPNDPENPLGERWIGLTGKEGDCVGRTGFGIHGTVKPQEIGKEASRGCIRLHNVDVEQLYDMVTEGETTVVVRD